MTFMYAINYYMKWCDEVKYRAIDPCEKQSMCRRAMSNPKKRWRLADKHGKGIALVYEDGQVQCLANHYYVFPPITYNQSTWIANESEATQSFSIYRY